MIVTDTNPFYVEADNMEEALEIAREKTAEFIKEVRYISSYLYRKSTKTITVEV